LGVTTSFFSATFEQLAASAPGWVTPNYGAFSEKEVLNPFTKEKFLLKQHELLSEPPQDSPPEEIGKLIKPGRKYAWKLAVTELEELMRLMTDAPEDKVAEVSRRALIGPDDAETWVFEIPEPFVRSLVALSATRLSEVAKVWQNKMDWKTPPTALLEELVAVATEAVGTQQRMFAYVSL